MVRKTRTLGVLMGVAIAVTAPVTAGAEVSDGTSGVISAAEATSVMSEVAPSVVAPTEPATFGDTTLDPGLIAGDLGLKLTGADTTGWISREAADGMRFKVDGAPDSPMLELTPTAVSADATSARVANDVAVYANTAPSTDMAIRPVTSGVEAFVQLRDASAPTTFAWDVRLPHADEQLVQLDSNTVAVAVAPQQQPAPTPPADQIADPNDTTPPEQAGEGSAHVNEGSQEATAPAQETLGAPAEPAPAGDAEQTVPVASVQVEAAMERHEDAQAKLPDLDVLAVISAPWATDAAGKSVPLELTAEGNQVVMNVKPQADTAFPVVADPIAESSARRRCFATQHIIRVSAAFPDGSFNLRSSAEINCDYVIRTAPRQITGRIAIEGYAYGDRNYRQFSSFFCGGGCRELDMDIFRHIPNRVNRNGCYDFEFHAESAGEYINARGNQVRIRPDFSPNNVSGKQCRVRR